MLWFLPGKPEVCPSCQAPGPWYTLLSKSEVARCVKCGWREKRKLREAGA